MADTRWVAPREIARQLGISPEKVVGWIRSGQLMATNVGDGAMRPRFRVSPEALERFLAARSTAPAPRAVRRQKRRTDVHEWY